MSYNYKKNKTQRGTLFKHVFAVFMAGGLSKTILAPLERIKLLLQVQPLLKINPDQQFTSARQAFFNIHSQQGFKSLWRGNFANILRIIPNAVFRFSLYHKFKQYFLPYSTEKNDRHFLGRLIAGTATGMFSMIFNYPFDVLRVRLACDMGTYNTPRQYNGMFDCTKKMVMQEGLKSFYKGYIISNLGIAPFLGFSFASYDTLMYLYPIDQKYTGFGQQIIKIAGIGTLSGIIASFITYPLDTLRRRMQMNTIFGFQHNIQSIKQQSNSPQSQNGIQYCVQQTFKTEGIKGFYKGFGVSLIKVIPAVIIQFTIYDNLKEFIFE